MAPDQLAASAPASPDAPATRPDAGRLSSRSDPPISASAASIALAALGDLRVGERPVGGPELEPQREALAPLADLLAAVEVEDVGDAQQLAAARRARPRGPAPPGTSSSTTTARSWWTAGIGRDVLVVLRARPARRRPAARGRPRSRRPLSRSQVAADQRVELAEPAGLLAADQRPAPRGPGAGTAASPGSTSTAAPSCGRERLEQRP